MKTTGCGNDASYYLLDGKTIRTCFAGTVIPYRFPFLERGWLLLVLFSMEMILSGWMVRNHKGKFLRLRNIPRRLESIPQQINCFGITGSL